MFDGGNGLWNKGKKMAGDFAKRKLRKLVITALKKGVTLLAKGIMTFLGTVGLPTILAGFGLVIIVACFLMLSSFVLSSGDEYEPDKMTKELQTYIKEKSYASVDWDKVEQRKFRVPEKLIAATIQMEAFYKKEGENGKDDAFLLKKWKGLVDELAEDLKPEFTYGSYTEMVYTKTVVTEDGETTESISKEKRKVDKIESVVAWDINATYTYEKETTDWKLVSSKTETIKKEKHPSTNKPKGRKVVVEEDNSSGSSEKEYEEVTRVIETFVQEDVYNVDQYTKDYDYTAYDDILNKRGYSIDDKKFVEALYEANGGKISYTNWLGTVGETGFDFEGFDGEIVPGSDVPAQFMPYYLAAQKKYGVDWYYLAAIHWRETRYNSGVPKQVSPVGAQGPMQFMVLTWLGWSYPGGDRLGNADIPEEILTNPKKIKRYGGYGIDANGDGKASPWDVEDAIMSAAHLLVKNGFRKDVRKAIFDYNHEKWYVDQVVEKAKSIKANAKYIPTDGPGNLPSGDGFMVPAAGIVTSGFGYRPSYGGNHYGIDIGGANGKRVNIYAAADGRVSRSYFSSSYGNVVFIQHKINGVSYETVYAHMTMRSVSGNQQVKKGTFLGIMGETGQADGVHLHFEIHSPLWSQDKGNAKNPEKYVPFR